jgi:hypothetical protein
MGLRRGSKCDCGILKAEPELERCDVVTSSIRLACAMAAWLVSAPVAACSCAMIAFESLIDQAETVMVVRILRVEDLVAVSGTSVWARSVNEPPPYSAASTYGTRAEFKVTLPLKQTGPLPKALRTGYGGGDCGVSLEPGSNYLILTDADGSVGMCSRPRKIGFQDGISCQMQAFLAAVERRIADGSSEVVWPSEEPGSSPTAVDERVSESMQAGRSAFQAGCDDSPAGGRALQ